MTKRQLVRCRRAYRMLAPGCIKAAKQVYYGLRWLLQKWIEAKLKEGSPPWWPF